MQKGENTEGKKVKNKSWKKRERKRAQMAPLKQKFLV
jgi:hypothetical protein